MTTYWIGMGLFGDQVTVEYEGIPPCLWCGEPVKSPSMDGPLVCPLCDMGRNKDGSKWTQGQYDEKRAHFVKVVEEAKAAMPKKEGKDEPVESHLNFNGASEVADLGNIDGETWFNISFIKGIPPVKEDDNA